MKNLISHIISDKILRWSSILSLLFILLTLIIVIIAYRNLPPLIPLYNQMPWVEARLGRAPELFIPPTIAFSVFLINVIFSQSAYTKMPLVARMLCVTSFLISLIMSIFIIRTIQLIY